MNRCSCAQEVLGWRLRRLDEGPAKAMPGYGVTGRIGGNTSAFFERVRISNVGTRRDISDALPRRFKADLDTFLPARSAPHVAWPTTWPSLSTTAARTHMLVAATLDQTITEGERSTHMVSR
jgi:hypothetical protein